MFDEESESWLWYGNREWGLGLGNFIPKAEMTVDATVMFLSTAVLQLSSGMKIIFL